MSDTQESIKKNAEPISSVTIACFIIATVTGLMIVAQGQLMYKSVDFYARHGIVLDSTIPGLMTTLGVATAATSLVAVFYLIKRKLAHRESKSTTA